ncbi:MAG: glycosyltransferase family 4 protein [Verrucomicrobiota bacterium]|nr:glycosyltransferase family 4 protein [Verrucomicrobiota bacterium]
MKIALVVHDALRGVGHGRYVVELANALSLADEVTVVANRFDPELAEAVKREKISAIRWNALSSIFTFYANSSRRLRQLQFDLVHAQGLTCAHAEVITAHICNAARSNRSGHRLPLRNRLFPKLVVPAEKSFYQKNKNAAIIAISKVVAEELKTHYSVQTSRVIYHGVDSTRFHPPTLHERSAARLAFNLPTSGPVWLFMGEAIKGLDETFALLATFPTARLLVVTRSDARFYRSHAKSLGIADRVFWAGPLSNPERAFHAADLFIYPSSYDAFGMVVSEAMASGLPTLVGAGIGAAEWIKNRINGFVLPIESSEKWHLVLQELHEKTEFAAEIGAAARMTAMEHSWAKCVEQTKAIYEAVSEINGKAQGSGKFPKQ